MTLDRTSLVTVRRLDVVLLTEVGMDDEAESKCGVENAAGPVLCDGDGGEGQEGDAEESLKGPVLVSVCRVRGRVRGCLVDGALDVGLRRRCF